TSPAGFLVVGGLFHLETHFGRGTDLGLLARVATQGFQLGTWGVALDLGGYERFWGVGSEGGVGALVLGAPWGLTLRGEGAMGTNDARSFGIHAEQDPEGARVVRAHRSLATQGE